MTRHLIRELNDAFRTTFEGGQVVLTASVGALPSDVRGMAIHRVATFTAFDEANDPRGEHDFGNFTLAGHRFLWKIDYYDPSLRSGSEDPSDRRKTARVLTIMLAEDY